MMTRVSLLICGVIPQMNQRKEEKLTMAFFLGNKVQGLRLLHIHCSFLSEKNVAEDFIKKVTRLYMAFCSRQV